MDAAHAGEAHVTLQALQDAGYRVSVYNPEGHAAVVSISGYGVALTVTEEQLPGVVAALLDPKAHAERARQHAVGVYRLSGSSKPAAPPLDPSN